MQSAPLAARVDHSSAAIRCASSGSTPTRSSICSRPITAGGSSCAPSPAVLSKRCARDERPVDVLSDGPDSQGPGAAWPREGWSAMLRSVATQRNSAVIPCASVRAAIFRHWRRIPGRDERPLRRAQTAAAESLCTTSRQRRVRLERAAQRTARTRAPASFSLMCACRTRDSVGYAHLTATCQSAGSTLAVNAAARSPNTARTTLARLSRAFRERAKASKAMPTC